jgi:protein transport protein SEC20
MHQTPEDSSATLRSTSAQHDVLTLVMGTSKQLITALERADWLDRMLVAAGLSFFVLVVLFIIKQVISLSLTLLSACSNLLQREQ